MEKYSTVGETRDDNITRHKRCVYWIVKTTDRHLEYLIVIVCSRQKLFRKCSLFLCLYVHCLSFTI